MIVRREFSFDAAHQLPKYHGKCEKLHGHTYHLGVSLWGEPDEEGMVCDFSLIKTIVAENVLSCLDHSYLNDIIPNPTAENIARWVWEQLALPFKKVNCSLFEVQVWETADCSAIYRGEGQR